MRRKVKRLLRKQSYPPDKREDAVATVIEQAERVCMDWDVRVRLPPPPLLSIKEGPSFSAGLSSFWDGLRGNSARCRTKRFWFEIVSLVDCLPRAARTRP